MLLSTSSSSSSFRLIDPIDVSRDRPWIIHGEASDNVAVRFSFLRVEELGLAAGRRYVVDLSAAARRKQLESMQLAVVGIRRGLTIDPAGEEEEAPAARFGRLVRESPVVILAQRGCYMAHVMKNLLAAVRAHATVIELESAGEEHAAAEACGHAALPALFVGGAPVGGLEGVMALHLGGRLVPRLREVGALRA